LADGAIDLLTVAVIVIGNQDFEDTIVHWPFPGFLRGYGISTMRQ
jgi:hypothetical protein